MKEHIGYQVMKRSGSTFTYPDGSKTYFATIVGVEENPYTNRVGYLLDTGNVILRDGCVIIFDQYHILINFNRYSMKFYLNVVDGKIQIEGEPLTVKAYRVIGKYVMRAGLVDTFDFNCIDLPKSKHNSLCRKSGRFHIHDKAIAYQHRVCGDTEYQFSHGEVTYLADGIRGDRWLLEAKYVENIEGEAYCGNADPFTQQHIDHDLIKQFTRIQYIIDNTDLEGVILITNTQESLDYLRSLLHDFEVSFELVE